MENSQDIQPVQTWGAFYFVRRAMDIRTKSEIWTIEAGKIIVKIIALTVAFIFDVTTGVLYIVFILIKVLVIQILAKVFEAVLQKILSVVAYLISLILTIIVLYLIFTHWSQFTQIINHIITLFYGN